jgi:hypothetical protein
MRWGVVAGGVVLVAALGVGLRVASNRGASSGVDIALSHLPPGYAATHGAIAFNPVLGTAHVPDFVVTHDGVTVLRAAMVDVTGIGSLVGGIPTRVGHVTLHDVSAPPALRHVDRVEADGLDIATGRAVFDPAAYPGAHAAWTDRRPLLGSLDVYGVVMAGDGMAKAGKDADVHVVHARLSDVAMRQFMLAPTPEVAARPAFIADAARAVRYHEALVEGISLDLDGGGTFGLDSVTVRDYDGGKIGSEALANFYLGVGKPKGSLRLAKMELTGVDATRLLDRLPDLTADSKTAARKLSGALRVGGLSMRDLKVDFARGPLVTLDSVDSHSEYTPADFSTGGGTLRNLNVTFTGRNVAPAVQVALQNFGMMDFSLDVDSDGSFDRGTGHLVAKQEDFKFKGLGTLHVTGEIDGLKLDAQPTRQDPAAAFADARLLHGELTWDDASLVARVFKLAELRTGQTEAALRATLALPLASAVAFFPDQPDVADQINAFLDGRHSLTVTLSPPTPVRLVDVTAAAPAEKAHLLGIRIKGN